MKVLISGGTGLIGTALSRLLLNQGHSVVHLSRSPGSATDFTTYKWDPAAGVLDEKALLGVTAIVHLAGAGIADSRWTERRKKLIIDSRVESANLLLEKVREHQIPLEVFVSASGINYYGMKTVDKIFTEDDPPSDDFIGRCCLLWEQAADQFADLCRVVKLRTGVVLSENGGALERIARPIKWGLGAPLGSGEQWVPYIHMADLCRMYLNALENRSYRGVYNAVNGDHVTNADLTRETAAALKKPLWLPNVPSFAIKLAFGEMGGLV
jgi:hypothetical protein